MTSASTASRGRRWWWWLIGAVALVGAAWAALMILLPPERIRLLAQSQLSARLTRDVRFRDTGLGIWPPVRITVKNLELAEAGGFSRGIAFQTQALHLDLDVFALLGGGVRVRRLVLDQPAVHFVLRPDGSTNLDGVMKPPPPGSRPARGMDLDLQEFVIDRGRLLIDLLEGGRRFAFELDTQMRLSSRQGGQRVATSGQSRITGLTFGSMRADQIAELDSSLAKLNWLIEHRGAFDADTRRLALERLALSFGRTELVFTGRVDDPGSNVAVDLRARGSRLDLAEVLSFLAVADAAALHGIQGKGRLDFDLGIRGRMGAGNTPQLVGALSVMDGSFRYPGAPAAVNALAFHARFAPDTVRVRSLTARVGDTRGGTLAPVTGTLMVTRFTDPRLSFNLRGDLDLAAVSPLVAPKDTRVTGFCRMAVAGAGPLDDIGAMALDGVARLANVSVSSPQLPKKIESIVGEVQFSQAQAALRGLSFKAGQSSLRLDATIARPLALTAPSGKGTPARVSFHLQSPYLDLTELLPVTPGEPLLHNAAGTGTVAIGRLRNQKLDVSNVSAQISMTPITLNVTEYAFQGYGGRVSGRASFDLARPERPGYDVAAKVDNVEANDLLSTWTPARDWIHGRLSTTIDFSGLGTRPEDLKRTLTAVGLALISNGTLGPGPAFDELARKTGIGAFREIHFKDLKLPFRVEQGRVFTDKVGLDGPYGRWQLAGFTGFDGSLDYAVSVTLPGSIAQRLGSRAAMVAGALRDSAGNVLLDLRVTGTAKAPRVTLDTRAMRDRVAGRISQALVQQSAKLEDQARAAIEERRKAIEDTARATVERARDAVRDSLRRRATGLLHGFFGGRDRSEAPKDTASSPAPAPPPVTPPATPPPAETPPRDTTVRDTSARP